MKAPDITDDLGRVWRPVGLSHMQCVLVPEDIEARIAARKAKLKQDKAVRT
jgi:hypothetical protein